MGADRQALLCSSTCQFGCPEAGPSTCIREGVPGAPSNHDPAMPYDPHGEMRGDGGNSNPIDSSGLLINGSFDATPLLT